MSNEKITDLTENTSPALEDMSAQVDDPSGTPATKKVSNQNLLKLGPKYVDRGDPASVDLDYSGMTIDNAWHDWDLSSIVPAGTIAVIIQLIADTGTTSYRTVQLRKNGNSNSINIAGIFSQVDNLYSGHYIVPCDSNRVIEYRVNDTFTNIQITIAGYFVDNVN